MTILSSRALEVPSYLTGFYDSYTAEGNELMELVDFVVETGVLPAFLPQTSYTVSITSCSRVAIELRNFLQNTVEQGSIFSMSARSGLLLMRWFLWTPCWIVSMRVCTDTGS